MRSLHVPAQDQGLVLDYTDTQREGGDGDVFVAEVDAGVAGQVAEDVVGGVEVGDGVGLVADEVVEAVRAGGVDEAVAYPLAGSDAV